MNDQRLTRTKRQKRQKDKKTKRWWIGLQPPTAKIEKGGGGGEGGDGGAVSSRPFDLMNSMIYGPKRSVDLRWLLDPVLRSSLDDLEIVLISVIFLKFKIWPAYTVVHWRTILFHLQQFIFCVSAIYSVWLMDCITLYLGAELLPSHPQF